MTLNVGSYQFLAPSAPTPSAQISVLGSTQTVSARVETLKDIRQDAKALKQSWNQAPVAPAFSLPSLNSILDRFLGWLSGATPPAQPPRGRTTFNVSSFNILGSLHTAGGKGGYASGPTRAAWAAQVIEQRGVDVVGFQEFASDQAREFKRVAGGEFGTFPGPSKRHLGSHNTIAWRKDTWKLVESYTVDMPSHKGRMQPSPVVRLKNKHTGQEVYFTNFHNAPGFHINQQQHWRDQATTQQVALINKLKRSGLPVIVTGDMNEKANYHRRLTNEAGMDAANELKNGSLPRALYVDWIFGSQDVTFKGFHRERKPVLQKISDHGMLVSKVVVGKRKG